MTNFICPKCKESLVLENKSYTCSNRHCYDLAKEGYVNLLPINSKKSKDPGDNSKMTIARRDFLQTDNYKPLADRLVILMKELLGSNTGNILDLGCGEGYYTGIISKELNSFNFCALDISKVAVRYASKRYKDINFCVASAFDLPIHDNWADIVYRIYAPSSDKELNRIIKKNGYLITVTPGDRHLYQLREIIYDEVLNLSTKDEDSETLKIISSENLKYEMNISDSKVIENLLYMTPFGWKISKEDHQKLMNQQTWNIEIDFKISVYQKA